ncbi:MAG: ComEC/Rec2 family competence protein, partial [Candidatus Anammoxibacter sp.]
MKRYPLVVITISFIFGILLDGMLDLPFRPLFAILIGLLVILLLIISLFINCRYRNLKNIVCIAVIILTGSAYHHYRFYSYPVNNIINFISDEKSLARLQGVIVSPPYKKAGFNPRSFNSTHKNQINSKKTIFLLRVNNILLDDKWQPITGNVRVSVYPEDLYAVPEKDEHTNEHDEFTFLPLKYGDEVEIVGKIFNPKPPTNPGQFDYKKYLARHEPPVRGLMSVASMHNLKLLSREHGNPVFRFVY